MALIGIGIFFAIVVLVRYIYVKIYKKNETESDYYNTSGEVVESDGTTSTPVIESDYVAPVIESDYVAPVIESDYVAPVIESDYVAPVQETTSIPTQDNDTEPAEESPVGINLSDNIPVGGQLDLNQKLTPEELKQFRKAARKKQIVENPKRPKIINECCDNDNSKLYLARDGEAAKTSWTNAFHDFMEKYLAPWRWVKDIDTNDKFDTILSYHPFKDTSCKNPTSNGHCTFSKFDNTEFEITQQSIPRIKHYKRPGLSDNQFHNQCKLRCSREPLCKAFTVKPPTNDGTDYEHLGYCELYPPTFMTSVSNTSATSYIDTSNYTKCDNTIINIMGPNSLENTTTISDPTTVMSSLTCTSKGGNYFSNIQTCGTIARELKKVDFCGNVTVENKMTKIRALGEPLENTSLKGLYINQMKNYSQFLKDHNAHPEDEGVPPIPVDPTPVGDLYELTWGRGFKKNHWKYTRDFFTEIGFNGNDSLDFSKFRSTGLAPAICAKTCHSQKGSMVEVNNGHEDIKALAGACNYFVYNDDDGRCYLFSQEPDWLYQQNAVSSIHNDEENRRAHWQANSYAIKALKEADSKV